MVSRIQLANVLADEDGMRTSGRWAMALVVGGCVLCIAGCGTSVPNSALSRLRTLESAARALERVPYTAEYQATESVTVVYSQSPAIGQVVESKPNQATLTFTTDSSGSSLCSKRAGAAVSCNSLPASGSVFADFHSPASALGSLRSIADHVTSGQSVAMSTTRIDGLQAYCFSGQAAGSPATDICFTSAGILAYYNVVSLHLNQRLTSYRPSSLL